MKGTIGTGLLCLLLLACSHNTNMAQSKAMSSNDSLVKMINSSKGDTEIINPKLKQLQQENDLVISFGSLNYAWARKGSFYVLAQKGNTWKAYRYDTRLPATAEDAGMTISPLEIPVQEAERIKAMYTKAQLWKTGGDNGENFCSGKKNCNINDAEAWTLSVATQTNIHTTSYYAPEFFEECCPGNEYRKAFTGIAKAIMKVLPAAAGGTDR